MLGVVPAESVLPQPRAAKLGDLDAMLKLKTEAVDAAFSGYPAAALAEWKSRFVTRQYFSDRLRPGSLATTFYVLGPAQDPDAMIALKERDGRAYIGDLYVRSDARGRGLGRHLLRHALAEALAQGYSEIVADVFEDNLVAAALLVSEGFTEIGRYHEPSLRVTVHRLAVSAAA
jgi:ribosomal protein S18 acetylase RimI-like enzyme